MFRWDNPLLSCPDPGDLRRAAEPVFETFPRGMAVGGCDLLLKVLGGQGQSLRVWGPGDGDSRLGSYWPLPMTVTVHQVVCSSEPCFEKHSSPFCFTVPVCGIMALSSF